MTADSTSSRTVKNSVPLLIISGPIGVGKSTVGGEVSDLLDEQGIAHTFIDLDQLRYTYPRPAGDRFGTQLGLDNLRDVWRNCAAAGSRNLVIASVVEDWDDVGNIASVIPESQSTVCQLRASWEVLEARVRRRELGSGLAWHLRRSQELSEILGSAEAPMDFEVETDDRTLEDIAQEIVRQMRWNR